MLFDTELFFMLVGETLNSIDPEGLAVRPTIDAAADFAAITLAAFNFGMSAEDAALLVLAGETLPC